MASKEIARLLENLCSPSHRAQEKAYHKLERLSPLPPECLPALIAGLSNPDLDIRIKCVLLIGDQEALAEPAIPHLAAMLCNAREDSAPRSHAAVALGKIGEAARPCLRELLHHPDPVVRSDVIDGLVLTRTAENIPLLIGCLRDPASEVRSHATEVLTIRVEEVDPQATMSALLEVLQSPDKAGQAHAAHAVWLMDPTRREPLAVIQALLKNEQASDILMECAEALECCRVWDVATVRLLARHLRHSNQDVRFCCLAALKTTDLSRHVVPEVAAALRSRDSAVRSHAAYVLSDLGPAAGAAVEALMRRLEKECDEDVQIALAVALALLGPKVRVVRHRLEAVLNCGLSRQAEELIRDALSYCDDPE